MRQDEDGGYLAVNPDWLEEQWSMLHAQPWFRGEKNYRRQDAIQELNDKAPGASWRTKDRGGRNRNRCRLRSCAEHDLAPMAGTFVVRVSFSEPGHYAISAKSREGKVRAQANPAPPRATAHADSRHVSCRPLQVLSMLILPSWAGPDSDAPGQTQYRLGTTVCPPAYSASLFFFV